jgi:hypothetical protein
MIKKLVTLYTPRPTFGKSNVWNSFNNSKFKLTKLSPQKVIIELTKKDYPLLIKKVKKINKKWQLEIL